MTPAEQVQKPLPRGWLSVALISWGALTDTLAGGIVMALMLEAIALSPIKWAMRDRDFHRAADLTSVVFGVITVVQFSRYSVHGIYEILLVSPFCFFPLVLAQRASTRQSIPMSALFYSLRRYPEQDRELDIAPHYIVLCIVAASTSDQRGYLFIGLAALLVVGLLARWRPRRYRWPVWLGALGLALAIGAGTNYTVLRAHSSMERSFMYWINQFGWFSGDPNKAMTAIGSIGRLKLSDQIRVRVQPARGMTLPLILQEASYDTFRFGTWTAHDASFEALDKLVNREAWDTAPPATGNAARLEITLNHRRELAVLPVPRGTRRIASEEIAELTENRFGTLVGESPPGALRYVAEYGTPVSVEPPPEARDLVIPDAYRDVIETVGAEIGLDDNAAATAARIRDFFLDNFKYSLIQRGGFGRRTPLAHFLTRTRRGHCEYFASAAVLLLRQAGIPARYAVGYVVEDYSELEGAYIARARHAHSWALAYVNGRWIRVDATPSVWFELENEFASGWQDVHDLGAWLWYRFQRLSQADFSELSDLMIWLVPPLAIVLYLRLRKSPTAVRDETEAVATSDTEVSVLNELLERLARDDIVPGRGDTVARFLRRVAPPVRGGVALDDLIRRYQELRFAARHAGSEAREALHADVARYCRDWRTPGADDQAVSSG